MKLDKNAVSLLLAQRKMTLREAARRANMSDRTIYKGFKKGITPKPVGKLAAALGVDPEDIIVKEQRGNA